MLNRKDKAVKGLPTPFLLTVVGTTSTTTLDRLFVLRLSLESMTSAKRTSLDILKSAEETLRTAEYGLVDLLNGPPERWLAGLRNVAVFGRATTNVLQNLRSVEASFDDWYTGYKEKMENDPLMKYFYELRSVILKEGRLDVSPRTSIHNLNMPDDLRQFGPPPPNSRGWFVGGWGVGWAVRLPDGSTEYCYVNLPGDMVSISLHFPKPPRMHLDRPIEYTQVEVISRIYIAYLRRVIKTARRKFIKK